MKIDEALATGATTLRDAGLDDPRAEAALLLGDLLGLDRLQLRAAGERELEDAVTAAFLARINRRATHEPAAYILGFRDFYMHRFRVTPDVLIPRPETELLVELALNAGLPSNARVLDLCCGSGCVGTSLQHAQPDWQVVCSDVSPAALTVARDNAVSILGAERVASGKPTFCESDLFVGVPTTNFDAILTNPPYIHPEEAEELDRGLSYEPRIALYHDQPEPFAIRILEEARERLRSGGLLAMETSPRWTQSLADHARSSYKNVRIECDINGLERTLIANAP